MAAEILGPRPRKIPPQAKPPVESFNELETEFDKFSNALVEVENLVPVLAGNGPDGEDSAPLPMLYFCIPRNDKMLGYWDTVTDRLYKIRHCMNIDRKVFGLVSGFLAEQAEGICLVVPAGGARAVGGIALLTPIRRVLERLASLVVGESGLPTTGSPAITEARRIATRDAIVARLQATPGLANCFVGAHPDWQNHATESGLAEAILVDRLPSEFTQLFREPIEQLLATPPSKARRRLGAAVMGIFEITLPFIVGRRSRLHANEDGRWTLNAGYPETVAPCVAWQANQGLALRSIPGQPSVPAGYVGINPDELPDLGVGKIERLEGIADGVAARLQGIAMKRFEAERDRAVHRHHHLPLDEQFAPLNAHLRAKKYTSFAIPHAYDEAEKLFLGFLERKLSAIRVIVPALAGEEKGEDEDFFAQYAELYVEFHALDQDQEPS